MPVRYDTLTTLASPVRMPSGFLRVDAHIARVGIQEYRDREGKVRRELRAREEVMHADSLASFHLMPVTNDHPPGLVTADNARKYQVGNVGERVREDGQHVAATMLITDAATIAEVEQGKVEVSCGYVCDYDATPGVHPEWGPYDGRQLKPRGNHVAIVDRGRAGSARLRLDAEDAASVSPAEREDTRERRMASKKIMVKGVSVEVEEAVAALIEAERSDAAKLLTDKSAECDRNAARADTAETTLKRVEAERNDAADPVKYTARVASRVGLVIGAQKVLGANCKLDGLSDRKVQEMVLAKLVPTVKLDGKTDVYVEARFDGAMEDYAKNNPALQAVRAQAEQVEVVHADSEESDEDKSRRAMIERNKEASKKR